MNLVVYSQFVVSTVGGTAYHLIKQYEDDNNGYVSWKALCECYYEDNVKNEKSDYLRSKLEIYHLTSMSNTSQYINNFLT